MRYQQNLKQAGVAVIVLVARTNRLTDLVSLIPEVRKILNQITLGEVIEIGNL